MPSDFEDWRGSLVHRQGPDNPPVIKLPLNKSTDGGTGAFLAADQDGKRWWIKPLNNGQAARTTVTETIVGSAGHLIGAPVCESAVVYLPAEIAGYEFQRGRTLEEGYAHASRHVNGVVLSRQLRDRSRDDNSRRHAGVFAIYDWCWGADDQWLYAEPEDGKLYSHDHGWYLPGPGHTWSINTLTQCVDEPHLGSWPATGLDQSEVQVYASKLRDLKHDHLVAVLSGIPSNWPVSSTELERVGWFLERRAPHVAARLEQLSTVQ